MIYYSTTNVDLTYFVDFDKIQASVEAYREIDLAILGYSLDTWPIGFIQRAELLVDVLCTSLEIPLRDLHRSGAEKEVIHNFVQWLAESTCGCLESSSFSAHNVQGPKAVVFVRKEVNDELRGDAW